MNEDEKLVTVEIECVRFQMFWKLIMF